MIPTAVDVRVKDTLDAADSRAMSIDATALTHLMSVLTNLYADPIAAVVREYSTNGYDATVEAGSSEPLRVTLPTAAAPTFVVQDYGVGMSTDRILDHYSLYGRSDKRGTNAQVGSLGLGCKSALTYCDSFVIESVHNGVYTQALVTKNDEGVGQIDIIDTRATTDRNGTKISIPVRNYDIASFRSKADRIYSFWQPGTVLVDGAAPSNALAGMTQAPGTQFYYRRSSNYREHTVVMGNVSYRVSSDYLNDFSYYDVVIMANIGDVSFAPSREELLYDTTTKRFLRDQVKAAQDSVTAHVSTILATAKSRWDALVLRNDNADLTFMSGVAWTYNGEQVPDVLAADGFTFEPGSYRSKATARVRVNTGYLRDDGRHMFITGFKPASVSAKVKAGLEEKYPDVSTFHLLSGEPDWIGWVPSHKWEDVRENIKDVKAAATYRAARNSRSGRIIDRNGNVTIYSPKAEDKPDETYVMFAADEVDESYYGRMYAYGAGYIPVCVYKREQATFAESFTTVPRDQVKDHYLAAQKAVTDARYLGAAVRQTWIPKMKGQKILDAEISDLLDYITEAEIDRILVDDKRQTLANRQVRQVIDKYPLVERGYGHKMQDIVEYVNAIYTYREDN